MRKHILLSALGGLLCASGAWAGHLSPEQALARATATTQLKAPRALLKSSPRLHSTVGSLYVFTSSQGYMILPAYDEAPALLGYSDNGAIDFESNPELNYWLDFYNRQLSVLKTGKQLSLKAVTHKEREAISPLTVTKWNQEAPYNDKCPELNGERSVTGCVATAMAQVMKYHNYPVKGKGSHSYDWNAGNETLTFNYGETTFDWDNMTDTYGSESTEAQRNAVATLMLSCGISVDMNYSPNESGASTIVMGTSLIDYYDYDPALWMPMRDYYGLDEWEDMIYADLAKGLPVLYAGQGTAGGHQFICDGYSSDGYFHFNWGWGGMSNGYFLLTALNPAALGVGGGAGGFNSGQQIALGVQPPVAGSKPTYMMYCTEAFTPLSQEVAAGELLECEGGFYNFSMHALPEKAAIGMRIVSADGSYDHYLESHSVADLPVLSGYSEDTIIFPELEDGEYTITPAFYDGEKWADMRAQVGKVGSAIATVSNGVATITSPQAATVTVSDINVASSIYIGRDFPMTFTVTNPGTTEYVGKLIPILIDENENMVAESVYSPLDVLGGDSMEVTGYVGKFTATDGSSLTPGTYAIIFCDAAGNQMSEPVEVTLEEAPASTAISVTSFSLISANPVTTKDAVEFSIGVECTEGYFTDALTVAIFPDKEGQVSSVAAGKTAMLYLNGGESTTATATLDLSTLEKGNYFAAVYVGENQESNTVKFELSDVETGIDEIGAGEKVNIIYDLQGRRCKEPLQSGLYIINGKKVIIK